MAKYAVSKSTADRALGMIAHHAGDIAAARHDVYIGLQSLGSSYTDRASSRVYELLDWIERKPLERRPVLLESLQRIANGEVL